MSVDCIFHIKTQIDRVILNQILGGEVLGEPHYEYSPDDLEARFSFRLSNDLHQLGNESWLHYEIKSSWTATIYKVRGRKIMLNYSLYDCADEVYDLQSDTIVEIEMIQ